MRGSSWKFGALVVLIALAASASSQTAAYTVPAVSVGVDFSSYHQALSDAADLAIANAARETEFSSQTAWVATKDVTKPDSTMLHLFAQQYWNGNDEAVRRAVSRVMQLKPVLAPILQEEGIPDEIEGLVLVESGGQPTALSPKGARGIWQFMPDTARRYGLTVTAQRDERLDVYKSTRAAALYLRALYAQFGDWSLVFAAYNAGENTIQRAIDRSGTTDFFQLRQVLPAETRSYVPAVWASFAQVGDGGGLRQLERLPRRGTDTHVFYAPTTTPSLVRQQVGQ